jgi:hypothetical protein
VSEQFLIKKEDGRTVRQNWPPPVVEPTTPSTAPNQGLTIPRGGIKHDEAKPDVALLSSIAVLKVAEVMTFGARKYDAHNWRKGFVWSRILSAALRHILRT